MNLASLKRILAKRAEEREVSPQTEKKVERLFKPREQGYTLDEAATRLKRAVELMESEKFPEPTLVIRNSYSTLFSIPEAALEMVRHALTYHNEGVEQERIQTFRLMAIAKSRGQGKLIFKLKKKLEALDGQEWVCWLKGRTFPTGHLRIVAKTLEEAGVTLGTIDRREIPKPKHTFRWYNQPDPLRYYQSEMHALALEHGRGVFESAVGTGKSRLLTEILHSLEVTSLIVLPSVALVEQTLRNLALAFGRDKITVVSSDVVKKGKKLAPIRLTTVQTLASLQKNGILKEVIQDVDLIGVDEIHHAGSKSYTDLLPELDHIYYRFGFTGTFLRNDCKTLDMWGFLSEKLYSYSAAQAIKEGFLTPVEFHIHNVEGKRHHNYQKEYAGNYCGSEAILERIELILAQIPDDQQVLILVDRKDAAGLVIHEFLNERGIENTYVSGDDKKDVVSRAIKDFNLKRIRVLIGSTIIGEGVDVYATDQLILARGGKSEIAIVQAIGRAVRLSKGKKIALVHDFRFSGTKFLEKHLDEARIIFYRSSFNGEVIEI